MKRPLAKLMALHALFEPGRSSGHPVCHDGHRLIGWGEFAMQVARLVCEFRQRQENRWLVTADDPLRFVTALIALLYAGKQVLVPPNKQPGTLAALADAYDVAFDGSEMNFAGATCNAQDCPASIDPAAAIIDLYTSGSTGEHKRIRKTLAQFEAELAMLEFLWGEQLGTAAIIATAPHQHIYGLLFRLLWPLASGRVFDVVTCANPHALQERLALFGRAALISSPAQLTRLPELLPLVSLEPKPIAVFSSGGPLAANAARNLADGIGQAPIEVFGSTETGGVAWRQRGQTDGDLWTPFPGHVIRRSEHGALILTSSFLPNNTPWVMDDAIDLMPDGRFRLLGRLDRIAKIEEKRLSLPEMEACLTTHAWVEAASVVPLTGRRQSIGAVLVLNAKGNEQLALEGKRRVTQALQQHLARHFDSVLLPRRWRFPECLPTNDRGKITDVALAALFFSTESKCLLPEVTALSDEAIAGHQVALDLYVLPEIAHFDGHFPGAPILPGVVQVDWAIHFARQYLPLEGVFSSLEKLKFLAVIVPGARLKLSLAWDVERKMLNFNYATATQKYATGRVVFGGAP